MKSHNDRILDLCVDDLLPVTGEKSSYLTRNQIWEIFEAQAQSRLADIACREMQEEGYGYYTIASSGHEVNAVVSALLSETDPALLHYRSGPFYCYRANRNGAIDPVRDILLGARAAMSEPISEGRHKVFGRRELNIIPQTSTIASHLPRAVGLAASIEWARKVNFNTSWNGDSIVVASFGDASLNHSTALGALNAAAYQDYSGFNCPVLFVCEDNGLGISVPTTKGWVAEKWGGKGPLRYFGPGPVDPVEAALTVRRAIDYVRKDRSPALLHLQTVRLMGHAGADVESAYRTVKEIQAGLASDPLLSTIGHLVMNHGVTLDRVKDRYCEIAYHVNNVKDEVRSERIHTTPVRIQSPITFSDPSKSREIALRIASRAHEVSSQSRDSANSVARPAHLTMAQALNRSLSEILASDDSAIIFGEDVGRKGGVYGVTRGLQRKFGRTRVFDTLLDEQTIFGLALGSSLNGFFPIPEIQYLAYIHNAIDQLRGEAATQAFFSNRQYLNPMLLRVAGYGYQKGFGGHFHNDNSIAPLLDIPGVLVASPSSPGEAAAMLQSLYGAALGDGRVTVLIEPIALYHRRDLTNDGRSDFLEPYPDLRGEGHVKVGSVGVKAPGSDLTILTFGNGVGMSIRAAKLLSEEGITARVVDIRWLAPLPVASIVREAEATGRVLIVDETRRTGSVSERIVTNLVEAGFRGPVKRVTSHDVFIPLGPAAEQVLMSESNIVTSARALLNLPNVRVRTQVRGSERDF